MKPETPHPFRRTLLSRGLLLVALAAHGLAATAQVTVTDAWVRATVPQQKASGLFAQITSQARGRLVGGSSPAAGVVEVHEMKMDGHVMKMRAVDALELPPGKAVKLEPGGYHVMLMDLKQQLKAGDTVPVTLFVEGPGGKREPLEVRATVRAVAAPAHKH